MTIQESSPQEPVVTKEELLKGFSVKEKAVILSVPAASELPDLAQFVRFSKYMRGEHHIEEMMYLENCSRYELLQVLDKFSSILVKHEHEDPIVTKYWSQTL